MTILEREFNELLLRLEPRGRNTLPVTRYRNSVHNALKGHMPVRDVMVVGSHARGTMIAPISHADIDMLVVLDAGTNVPEGNATLFLESMRGLLISLSPKLLRIDEKLQGISVPFPPVRLDVIPAFIRKEGGYCIPDPKTKQWMVSDPEQHTTGILAADRQQSGRLLPLIRIIKTWNMLRGYPFEPFYLELLAVWFFGAIIIEDYPSALSYFFKKGIRESTRAVKDPAADGGFVHGFRAVRRSQDAVDHFTEAYKRTENAATLVAGNLLPRAVSEWRKLFGSYFPSTVPGFIGR